MLVPSASSEGVVGVTTPLLLLVTLLVLARRCCFLLLLLGLLILSGDSILRSVRARTTSSNSCESAHLMVKQVLPPLLLFARSLKQLGSEALARRRVSSGSTAMGTEEAEAAEEGDGEDRRRDADDVEALSGEGERAVDLLFASLMMFVVSW